MANILYYAIANQNSAPKFSIESITTAQSGLTCRIT